MTNVKGDIDRMYTRLKKRCHVKTKTQQIYGYMYIIICIFKTEKTACSGLWLMRVARGNRNGASLPERFKVRNLALLVTFWLAHTTRISHNTNKAQSPI